MWLSVSEGQQVDLSSLRVVASPFTWPKMANSSKSVLMKAYMTTYRWSNVPDYGDASELNTFLETLSSVQAKETCRITEEHAESKSSGYVRSGVPLLLTVVWKWTMWFSSICSFYAFIYFSFIVQEGGQETPARTFKNLVNAARLCMAARWICDQCGWV